jgi:hypothetical protein
MTARGRLDIPFILVAQGGIVGITSRLHHASRQHSSTGHVPTYVDGRRFSHSNGVRSSIQPRITSSSTEGATLPAFPWTADEAVDEAGGRVLLTLLPVGIIWEEKKLV